MSRTEYGKDVYVGFDNKVKNAELIAVAFFDGEPDLWALEEGMDLGEAVKELERYYQNSYSRQPESLTLYRKAGER